MRRWRTWRYGCDYCRKTGCSASHMARHERRCTNNPNRECGMCRYFGIPEHSVAALVAVLRLDGLDALRSVAEGCPMCILAAIRQSGLSTEDQWDLGFDFKKERDAFWRDERGEPL